MWRNGKSATVSRSAAVGALSGAPTVLSGRWGDLGWLGVMGGLLGVFVVWPIASVLVQSATPGGTFSLALYRDLFSSGALLGRSFGIAAISGVLALGLGCAGALFVVRSGSIWASGVFAVFLLALISPPFVSSLAFLMLFGRRGIITYKILGLSLNPYGWEGIVIVQALGLAPMAALLAMGVLRNVDRSLEEAARDLGASPLRAFLSVTLPMAAPGMGAAGLLVFVRALADFGTPLFVGGNVRVLASEAYLSVIGLFDLPRAAAMSVVLALPALGAFVLYRRFLEHAPRPSPRGRPSDRPLGIPPGLGGVVRVVVGGFVLYEVLTYGTILWGAFARTWGVDFSFSLRHWEAFTPDKLGSYVRSLAYAFAAALVGSPMGIFLAYLTERRRVPGHRMLDFCATLPFMIPGPFLGIGYIQAFHGNPLPLTGTAGIVVANCLFRELPLGTKAGASLLRTVPREMEEAARDAGASPLRVFGSILLPQLRPALLASFIHTFTTTMTTVGAVIFLVTPASKVATVALFEELKEGKIGAAAVWANLLILTVLGVNLLFSWLVLRRRQDGPAPDPLAAAS